jgi:mono/diheme cytochrome c family protein
MKWLTAVVLGLAMMSGTAIAQEIGSVRQGADLAHSVCAQCHSVEKGDPRSPNGYAPTFQAIANTRGMTPMALRVALRTSHQRMPNLVLKEDERESVIDYILSLK